MTREEYIKAKEKLYQDMKNLISEFDKTHGISKRDADSKYFLRSHSENLILEMLNGLKIDEVSPILSADGELYENEEV